MSDFVKILIGAGVIILVGISFSIYENRKRLKYIKQRIDEEYGKEIDLSGIATKMESVASYFKNKEEKNTIDDITWNDLSMDEIFKKINNTQCSAGENVLYDILRKPLYSKDELEKRDMLIDYFRNNEKQRKNIQYILGNLGKSFEMYPTNCLFNDMDNSQSRLLEYNILSFLPILFLVLSFFNQIFIIFLIGSAAVNSTISQREKKKNYNAEGFSYILRTVKLASKIKEMKIEVIEENIENIDNNLKNIKHIKRKVIDTGGNNMISDMNVFSEYMNIIFLSELVVYEKVKKTIIKNKEDFKAIYEYVGTIDALIAIASFRDSLDFYTKPVLSKSHLKYENHLEFKDIYHPLVKNPVVNSGKFNKGVLLTGSNASGKSTFIKTVAINSIMAQTIYTCFARDYKSSYFNIYTSMALKDDIFSSESYYIVEIKSLKRILDNIRNDMPCLCFVDEILRGTNTVERIASSCEVLKHIGKRNTICFAATHDVELTQLLEGDFENYHFEETITNKDITFDYKLYKGRAETRNAIKLLDFMGYEGDLVCRADSRAKEFLVNGVW
ncbi:MAG: MutS-related protein [Paraclostridium sp.]